jgi:hypothetical protein
LAEPREDIDHLLFDRLNDAAFDAEGIDWNAFAQKRKKRRLVIWFWMLGGLLLLMGCVFLWLGWPKTNYPSKASQNPKQPEVIANNSESIIKSDNVGVNNHKGGDVKSSTKYHKPLKAKLQRTEPRFDYKASNNPQDVPEIIEEVAETYANRLEILQLFSKSTPSLLYAIYPKFDIRTVNNLTLKPIVLPITKNGLFVDIQAGPSLNIPLFKVSKTGLPFIHKDYETIRKTSEQAVSGFNFQIAVGKEVRKWNYSVGLGINQSKFLGNYDFVYSEKPVINPDGSIQQYLNINPMRIQYTSQQKLSFIEVPLALQYRVLDSKYMSAGLRLGYNLQFLNAIKGQLPNALFLDQQERFSTENYKTQSGAFVISIPITYKINSKSSVILIPEYKRGLGFNQIQHFYKTNFNYWGLNLNYRIKL